MNIADKYDKSIQQVILKWGLQRGCGLLVKSTNFDHQKKNLEVMTIKGLELTEEEMNSIAELDYQFRHYNCLTHFEDYDIFA